MAQELTLKIIAEGKNIKLVTGQVDKLGKEVKNTGNSMKNAGKQQDQFFNKQQKGVIGVANGTKSFSKMQQTIGSGSSGLVGAYATLAANVFAATAMFNALRSAARFDALTQGLEAMGNQSGQTLSVMARGLKDITEGAISTEEAFRSAALGASGGFGAKELGGLAKIAKGASLALGRDLGDAFDRLTRGAIKLEPEILDELGIMVRLDDAVEKYAAQLGKAGSALTQMERRQAFMNEILIQGEAKFGGIANAVDTNPYDRLAGALADLSEKLLSFINNAGVTAFVEMLSKNMFMLAGAALMVASTFAKQMLPILAESGNRALKTARDLQVSAAAAKESAMAQTAGLRAAMSEGAKGGKVFQDLNKKFMDGTATAKDYSRGLNSLSASQKKLQAQVISGRANGARSRKLGEEEIAQKNREIDAINRKISKLRELQAAEVGEGASFRAAGMADAKSKAGEGTAGIMGEMQGKSGLSGFKALPEMLKKTAGVTKRYKLEMMSAGKVTSVTGRVHVPALTKGLALTKSGFMFATTSAKLFGTALINAIPVIGQIVFFASLIGGAISNAMKTKETEAMKKSQKDLADILDSLPGKVDAFDRAQRLLGNPAASITSQYQILSNTIDEAVNKMEELIRKQNDVKLADKLKEQGSESFTTDINPLGGGGQDVFKNRGSLEGAGEYKDAFNQILTATEVFTNSQMDTLAAIKDDERFKTFRGLFDTGLYPDLMKGIDLNALIKGPEDADMILDKLRQRMLDTQKATKGLGPAFIGLAESFKTADIEFSKFLQTGVKKTPYDAIVKNMGEIAKNINKVKEELVGELEGGFAKNMTASMAEDLGKGLSGLGPMVGMVMGPAFTTAQDGVVKAGEARAKLERELEKAKGNATHSAEDLLDLNNKIVEATEKENDLARELGTNYGGQADSVLVTLSTLQKQVLTTEDLAKKAEQYAKQLKATIMTGDATGLQIDQQNEALTQRNTALTSQISLWQGIANQQDDPLEKAKIESFIGGLTDKKLKNTLAITSSEERAFQVTKASLAIKTKELAAEKAIASLLAQKTADLAIINEFENFGVKDPLTKFKAEVQAAKDKKKFAVEEANLKMLTLQAETDVIKARYELLALELDKEGKGDLAAKVRASAGALDQATEKQREVLQKTADMAGITMQASITKAFTSALSTANTAQAIGLLSEVTAARAGNAYDAAVKKAGQDAFDLTMNMGGDEQSAEMDRKLAEERAKKPGGEGDVAKNEAAKLTGSDVFQGIQGGLAELAKLGPEGELIQTAVNGIASIGVNFKILGEDGGTAAQKATAAMGIISAMGAIMAASSKAKIANIDREIDAEKKRDGKSKESLSKIAGMEKKKEQLARKAFEMSKKMQIASAIISTASAVVGALGMKPAGPWNIPFAIAMGAMGLAQIAMIQKTSFQGAGSGGGGVSVPQEISVGKRNSSVDVAKGVTGGETAFLRGERGIGSNANSFTPGGGAGMRKGYAAGGEIMVGEKGPEIIQPTQSGFNVIPNDKMGGGTTNANFTINAIDAAGVEEVLTQQRGNIIQMIRDAAHEHGEEFIEGVNTSSYDATNGEGGGY